MKRWIGERKSMHRRTYEQCGSFKYAVRVWYESILSQNKLFITKYIVKRILWKDRWGNIRTEILSIRLGSRSFALYIRMTNRHGHWEGTWKSQQQYSELRVDSVQPQNWSTTDHLILKSIMFDNWEYTYLLGMMIFELNQRKQPA